MRKERMSPKQLLAPLGLSTIMRKSHVGHDFLERMGKKRWYFPR